MPSKELELSKLVGFLLQRYGSKMILVDVLLQCCLSDDTDLQSVGNAFDLINRYKLSYKKHYLLGLSG